MIIVSVVMPVYNGEKYLKQSIQTTGDFTGTNGSIANKIKEVTPELCRVADERYRRLDRVLEQKPINDGVWNGLHLQKTNKNLRWYSVHRANQYHDR